MNFLDNSLMFDAKIKPTRTFQAQMRMGCNNTHVQFYETINLVTTDVPVISLQQSIGHIFVKLKFCHSAKFLSYTSKG